MENKRWLDRPIHSSLPTITNEVVIFILIILAALVTRFFNLEARVMSHDEGLHTYFSYLLYKGQGYQHTPMMHGPFQFHILALTYYLFGVSDFTARIPSVLFSIATVWMVWYWRRYLGRAGALIAGILLVISPYMLYYGRYVRNESFAGFSGIVMLYVMLRYLETGGKKYLYLLALALVLHFTAKETAFIYAAQALLYLAIYFIARVTREPWEGRIHLYRGFIITLAIEILLLGASLGIGLANRNGGILTATETAAPANPTESISPFAPPESGFSSVAVLSGLAVLFFLSAFILLIVGYSWERLRAERSFDLLILIGTLVLPNLTAFAIKFTENFHHVTIPTTEAEVKALSSNPTALLVIGIALAVMFGISILIGLVWNKNLWWKAALLFWGPFVVLYTTVFTNSAGFFTGTLGSLGYWIIQQGVERGSQPWYFYLLIQIPVYEFLPALGLILALFLGLRRKIRKVSEPTDGTEETTTPVPLTSEESNFTNTFSLLVWWSITSVAAFSYAGEKMPWLTYHITLPMILITGWALGHVVDAIDWDELRNRHPWTVLALAFVFVTSLSMSLLAVFSPTPPFRGKDLESLQATGNFLLPAIAAIASAGGLLYLLNDWKSKQILRTLTLTVFTLLAVLTMRASFRASYITYDQATEYLVYAHGASGIKQVMAQAKEISQRTTGGMGLALAYDASSPDTGVSWPFVWYLRDYTNQRSFDVPTRSLRDAVFVVVDQKNFDKIETALGTGYYRFDYIRMWWPNQDYFGLTSLAIRMIVNVPKIKGTHSSMKTGMLAAEAVVAALADGAPAELTSYPEALRESWVWEELERVRNLRPAFAKWGTYGGVIYAAIDTYLLRGRAPWTFRHPHPDNETLMDAKMAKPIEYPKPDGKLTFDRLSSVFISNTNHEENQPGHLQLRDPAKAIAINYKEYASPETRYCPAGVYEIEEIDGKPQLRINAQNCVHCKTCDIKDPTQNIHWVTPEGGGGPAYPGGM